MKRIILTLVTLLLTVNSFAISSWLTNSWPVVSWPDTFTNILSDKNTTNDDEWILVGEVTLTHTVSPGNYEYLKANLYIREVAHKIIYRIEYNGKFYAVSQGETECFVTIGQKLYHFGV